ncbi:unnamed protein product [Cuscuta campestris]|uniref:RING-type domain-containing protein n=1 Tax=Cuscuta campestris TaxID=132261 RepID=A0A484LKB0_9ASTE|nr:unnamed protein product [Cuscuta campestris]
MAVHTTWFCSQDPLLIPNSSQQFCPPPSSSSHLMLFPDPFPPSQSPLQQIPCSPPLKKQSLVDMDLFFQSESEKLREMVMEEQRRQQGALLQSYESRIAGVMRQREAELAMAKSRNRELQDLMAGAELEARLWERRAAENEAAVSELSQRLRQAAVAEREAEESCCGGGSTAGEGCRTCGSGRAMSVVFLPCRHLCCCKSCDVFLEACPVCAAVKEDSLQVILP